MNIAIAEDEPKLATLLQDYLRREDYQTTIYHHGTEALTALKESLPDLLLLDLMLPGTDGLTICKELRKTSDIPIIMITAKVEEIDLLLGLEVGADDYVCKPFSPREVVARVKAVMRRSANNGTIFVESTASVHIGEQICTLTAVELRLLRAMYERPGQIFNRAQLMQRMYEDNRIVSDRTIDSHVKKLRQKFEAADESTSYIHSVYGIGYKFEILSND